MDPPAHGLPPPPPYQYNQQPAPLPEKNAPLQDIPLQHAQYTQQPQYLQQPPQQPQYYVTGNPLMVLAPPATSVVVVQNPSPPPPVAPMWSAFRITLIVLMVNALLVMGLAGGACTGPWVIETISVFGVQVSETTVYLSYIVGCSLGSSDSSCTTSSLSDIRSNSYLAPSTAPSMQLVNACCALLSITAATTLVVAAFMLARDHRFAPGPTRNVILFRENRFIPKMGALVGLTWIAFTLSFCALVTWGAGVQASLNDYYSRVTTYPVVVSHGSGFNGIVTCLVFTFVLGIYTSVLLCRGVGGAGCACCAGATPAATASGTPGGALPYAYPAAVPYPQSGAQVVVLG